MLPKSDDHPLEVRITSEEWQIGRWEDRTGKIAADGPTRDLHCGVAPEHVICQDEITADISGVTRATRTLNIDGLQPSLPSLVNYDVLNPANLVWEQISMLLFS